MTEAPPPIARVNQQPSADLSPFEVEEIVADGIIHRVWKQGSKTMCEQKPAPRNASGKLLKQEILRTGLLQACMSGPKSANAASSHRSGKA